MSRKKISILVQAMTLFTLMDERDKQTLAEYVQTQVATPRKKTGTRVTPSAPAQKEPASDPKCGVCYEIEDHPNHDMTYSSAHEFDRPKSARGAGKRSSRKSAATNSIANSEIPPAVALGVQFKKRARETENLNSESM